MILPIVAYGDPVLKKMGEEIDSDYPELDKLIENMFETMEAAHGVGLAAPQIGKSIRLFVVDATPFAEDEDLSEEEREQLSTFRKTFINPIITEENGNEWGFEEGCLSIPNIREEVFRQPEIEIEYYDTEWNLLTERYSGIAARVIQHEYDHIEGVLFTDHLSALKKRFLKKKLTNISKGDTKVDYKMKFPLKKR
ncbi:MAG: peptide deformylase [Crocinitomicaceae bacterium]|nr:peptide deformylase [Crocinitomicaceae bacterium]|tara:strand:+ start:169 stop:753 length:585 start_codon:yes stop_codon:yes gene_type:complete